MVGGGEINIFGSVERGGTVFEELWGGSGSERCAIVEKVRTGSYEATLSRIGLSYIGFGGFPFGLFFLGGPPMYGNVLK